MILFLLCKPWTLSILCHQVWLHCINFVTTEVLALHSDFLAFLTIDLFYDMPKMHVMFHFPDLIWSKTKIKRQTNRQWAYWTTTTPDSFSDMSRRYVVSYQKYRPRVWVQLFSFEKWMVNDKMLLSAHNTKSWNLLIHLKTAGVSIYQGIQIVEYSLYIIHIRFY